MQMYTHVNCPYNDGILNEKDRLLKDDAKEHQLQSVFMMDDG